MNQFDSKLLKNFLKLAGETLSGNWVLLGGTVLPALGVEHRTTTDIDFVGLSEKEKLQQIRVMQIAEDLGLAVESINAAASYFFSKAKPQKEDLVCLHQGKSATIFRPSATFYILLKLQRFSESDQLDCVEMLKYALSQNEKVDKIRVKNAVLQELKKQELKPERKKRLEHFSKRIENL